MYGWDLRVAKEKRLAVTTELLAPAGDSDCAFAALHYGADAIYLGLKRFSARAEAGNFTAEQLSEIVWYAHSLAPRRSVYVALNTLVQDHELSDVLECLATVADIGVDALIVQDLGVASLARRHFPGLRLHASTQLAIHNLEGAKAARQLGFSRVTLARELSLREIKEITAGSGLETETFIHGALCYCYSGLCLYSAVLRGRSGNRGRCAYPCRDSFRSGDGRFSGLAFSMLDLALPDAVPELRSAGVASLKIEGRKKSPLYVASTVDFYRRILNGESIKHLEQKGMSEDIKTVFSRPWTKLYYDSAHQEKVIDPVFVGHRGARIGVVSGVVQRAGEKWLQFTTGRRLERHDGIQIDVAGAEKPFGFAVDKIQVLNKVGGWSGSFNAERQQTVLLCLPPEHPLIPEGATVYCSSSQMVKQRYDFPRPRPGVFRVRKPLDVEVVIGRSGVKLRGTVNEACAEVQSLVELEACSDASQLDRAVRGAFDKLGNTNFTAGKITIRNGDKRFVPVSLVNRLRRQLVESMDAIMEERRSERLMSLKEDLSCKSFTMDMDAPLEWLVKTDRLSHLDSWEAIDWQGVHELIVDIEGHEIAPMITRLAELSSLLGKERLRLALPVITRDWERDELLKRIKRLWDLGYFRWEVSSLAGQVLLSKTGGMQDCFNADVTADWPLYMMNSAAVQGLIHNGYRRLTLSPETNEANAIALLERHGEHLVLPAYQDTPLFISESCPQSAFTGQCTKSACKDGAADTFVSRSNEKVTVLHRGCRTIVINRDPLCLARRLESLRRHGLRQARVDFMWRNYQPQEVVTIWRKLRAGGTVSGIEGCFTGASR